MKTRKTYNPCFCTFVPPYILDRLSKASDGVIDRENSSGCAGQFNSR